MKKELNHIAIVRLSALGDIVNTAVVLQFIHAKFPDIKIDWITEEVFAPLLKNHPLIHHIHTVNLKQLKKEKSFKQLQHAIKGLRSLGEYDLIIDVQGLLKSAIVSRLIGKNTHGFDKHSSREPLSRFFYKTTSHIPYDANIVLRNTFLVADALGFAITPEMLDNKKPIFAVDSTLKLPKHKEEKKNIAFVIGASWKSKKYPKEHIIKVCKDLDANCFILWGDKNEKEEAEFIAQHVEHAIVAPKLTLSELISFISQMDLLIGNDTGPTHMAWGQNIPSITLLGPTTSRMIYETSKNRGIKSPSHVDIFHINKNDFSIKEINPQEIIKQAKELLHHGI
ncbi:MAG: lipopolysaccharide heptosyltransferase I [Sulfurimonadaceae bacterium]|jgi:heptosyltransferase-1|nr:lipopolysaccharide heptosyltransferase I [Sulfurimonadaceae bacterium]